MNKHLHFVPWKGWALFFLVAGFQFSIQAQTPSLEILPFDTMPSIVDEPALAEKIHSFFGKHNFHPKGKENIHLLITYRDLNIQKLKVLKTESPRMPKTIRKGFIQLMKQNLVIQAGRGVQKKGDHLIQVKLIWVLSEE